MDGVADATRATPPARDPATSRRAARAALIGTVLEYYDLGIYGLVASTVFASVFFPASSPGLGAVQAIATFSVAYVVRPIAGFFLGSLGDRLGRRVVLIGCLLTMGLATVGIGLVPGHDSIGWLAPVLLIVFRALQGVGASAEFSGAVLIAVEFAPAKRRGLLGSMPAAGASIGGVLATLMVLSVSALLSDDQFLSWGWRIPFLLSVVLVAYGLWLRLHLPESPSFEQVRERGATSDSPLRRVLRRYPTAVVTVLLLQFSTAGLAFFIQVFVVGYATGEVGLPRTQVLFGLLISQVVCAMVTVAGGWLADRYDPRRIMLCGLGLGVALAFPFFALIRPDDPTGLWIGFLLTQGVAIGLITGPFAGFAPRLLPAHLRFSGTATGRELGNLAGSGGVPLLAAQMAFVGGGTTTSLSILMLVVAALGLPALLLGRPVSATEETT